MTGVQTAIAMELGELIDELLDKVPPDFDILDLNQAYKELRMMTSRPSPLLKAHLDRLEESTAWYILMQLGVPKEDIASYPRDERIRKGRIMLDQDPRAYEFYKSREKAIKTLSSAGIVSEQDYHH